MSEKSFDQISPHVFARISGRVGGSNTGFILCEKGMKEKLWRLLRICWVKGIGEGADEILRPSVLDIPEV